jgi:hypothetical protein
MSLGERYKCDRNGGVLGRYLRRPRWHCPNCGEESVYVGHRCQDCRRRVCCSCFHHDLGACIGCPGCDSGQEAASAHPLETCKAAIARKSLNPGGGGQEARNEP